MITAHTDGFGELRLPHPLLTVLAPPDLPVTGGQTPSQRQQELLRRRLIKQAPSNVASLSRPPSWLVNLGINLGVHALVVIALMCVVVASRQLLTPQPPMRVAIAVSAVKTADHHEPNRLAETATTFDVSDAQTPSQSTEIAVPAIENEVAHAMDMDELPSHEQSLDSAAGSTKAFLSIGGGSGRSLGRGIYSNRRGVGKHMALQAGGGNQASEAAVDRALLWLKRHQDSHGSWNRQYPENCHEAPKCVSDGPEHEISMTGYALLCFMGAGFEHRSPSRFHATCERALHWLLNAQAENGSFGTNYDHAVATMALGEAYAMTRDISLKAPLHKAVEILLARQNRDSGGASYGRLGWDYIGPDQRNDTSVTGWVVMALKDAAEGGLNAGLGLQGARTWLDSAWHSSNPNAASLTDPYHDASTFCYTWDYSTGCRGGWDTLIPVGALCAVILGHNHGDMLLESLCNATLKQLPQHYPCNTYALYYGTLALFQTGGARWKAWNSVVRPMLVDAQVKGGGCPDGSWDHASYGRFYDTCWCCLSLEVYYRYKPMNTSAAPGADHP